MDFVLGSPSLPSLTRAMTRYMPLFRSCTTLRSLTQLHAHLLVAGRLGHDPVPATKLIESYCFMGSLDSSRLVFQTFLYPDSFMYGVFIKCHVWYQFFQDAIDLYHRLVVERTQISKFVFPSVLRACAGSGDLGCGKKVHGTIIKSGVHDDAVIESSLLCLYGETGCLDDAKKVFDEMPMRDLVAWSTMVSSCVENGEAAEGLEMFRCMVNDGVELDTVTMISVVEGCAELGCSRTARSVHGQIMRKMLDLDEALGNSILTMHSKCSDLFTAEKIFVSMVNKNAISWTAMISAYNRGGFSEKALRTFIEMLESETEPSLATLCSILSSCGMLGRIREAKSVHGFAIRKGLDSDYKCLSPSLVELYAESSRLHDCEKVLHTVGEGNIVSWNFLISLYAQKGMAIEALHLLMQMMRRGIMPDSFSLATSISACGNVGLIQFGNQIHSHALKAGISDEFVQNSMIDMYSKCGLLDSAWMIFDQNHQKSVVAWNSMLCGLSQNGSSLEAINLFDCMFYNHLEMNEVTFLAVIQACSNLGFLEKGKWVHHKLLSFSVNNDLYIDTSLIDMYGKCGDLSTAERVFRSMPIKSVVSWSTMINSYGMHGQIGPATVTFKEMVESGIEPNEVAFMNILSACAHSRSVDEGKFYFNLMRGFGAEPNSEHFACVIDLLSRAGDLQEAYWIIKSMPFLADASVWGSLVNGCRIHRRMDTIKAIKKDLLDIRTDDTGYYTLLSNIYAEEEEWEEFRRVRSSMRNSGLKKVPGYSTVEINNKVFRFGAGDSFHLESEIDRFLGSFQNLASYSSVEESSFMTEY